MRRLAILLLLAAAAPAGDLALVAIRDDPKQEPDATPPRTIVTVDIMTPARLVESRRVAILDPVMRRRLFDHPFVFPARADAAYLVCRDGKGLRSLRLSWSRGQDVGKSVVHSCPGIWSRPRWLVTERIGFFTDRAMVSLDLRLGTTTRTRLNASPLDICPTLNRLYVKAPHGIAFHPLLASSPPPGVKLPPQPLFRLPDKLAPERATVTEDGLVVAYSSKSPTPHRFLLSVADSRRRLIVRRSVPGRLHNLRWLDKDRLVFTTERRETYFVHVLVVGRDGLTTRRLPTRYLAPPEIVPAAALGLKGQKG